ncbi:gliding motility protein GldC [Empedobacter brevis]|uniref:gliding motility protein GldC n=1 Tax=Empedobacter brevis TaxID=247 RepID=UPI0039AF90CC
MRTTNISVEIELDENHVPEKMTWNAPDGGISHEETKAMLLSVWDDKAKEALRIDLWTKEMTQDDMKRFFHQILISMSSSYERATEEKEVAQRIAAFAEEFAIASQIKG